MMKSACDVAATEGSNKDGINFFARSPETFCEFWAGIFGVHFCGVHLYGNRTLKILEKLGAKSGVEIGTKFVALSFCNFSDLESTTFEVMKQG